MARIPHLRHVRHRKYDRLRHSTHFLEFLTQQGERLSMTPEAVFEDLMVTQGFTADQIANMAAGTAPTVTTAATITGTPTVGQTLTVGAFVFAGDPTPTATYEWERDGVAITSATATTYVLVTEDIGANITCTVTGTNTAGSVSTTSNALGPVVAA